MKVLNCSIEEIYKIIEAKAKYQKVILLFDDEVSNIEIAEIYNAIKEICIYNQINVSASDINEIYNGYRAIIYLCSCKSCAKLDFDKKEFVNLCIIKDYDVLPYCLNFDLKLITDDVYLLCEKGGGDLNLQSSYYFNSFYNYFNKVLKCNYNLSTIDFDVDITNIFSLKESVKKSEDFEFIDFDILKKTNIDYKHFWLVHLILTSAILMLLTCVKNKNLKLVDIYKSCKEDYAALDKFYIMANNDFISLININYSNLINMCIKTKEKILDCYGVFEVNEEIIKFVINELKVYAKNCDGLLGYLYLYDLLNF